MSFSRALSLARYNWPLYAVCIGTVVCGIALALISIPFFLRVVALFAAATAGWFAIASFLAFHVMFDRPELLSGLWLQRCVSTPPKTCVQLSVCVEETTLPIATVFPAAACTNLDLFDESVMTEPAVARAKQSDEHRALVKSASPEALPLEDGSVELTVVMLAAHEVRDEQLRKKLFLELARITEDGGRIVIAEHLRDIAAALAFGPGLFHFYSRKTWVELATHAGLSIESEFSVTPFVHVFVLQENITSSRSSIA